MESIRTLAKRIICIKLLTHAELVQLNMILSLIALQCYTYSRRLLLIHSFRDKWLQDSYLENKYNKKIAADKNRLFRKLQLIDDATCDIDLRSPPSNHFEMLK